MAMTVRRFAPDEWRLYRELRLHALADAPDAFGSTYEREAARTELEWEERLRIGATAEAELPVVALIGETPVGLAWARDDEHEPGLAHLFQVWVAPPHRGQGVGRSLTNAVIAWAQARGLRSLRLGVTPSHPAALQLYRNAGFVNAGKPEPLRPGSSVPCQPMRLELNVSPLRSSTGG